MFSVKTCPMHLCIDITYWVTLIILININEIYHTYTHTSKCNWSITVSVWVIQKGVCPRILHLQSTLVLYMVSCLFVCSHFKSSSPSHDSKIIHGSVCVQQSDHFLPLVLLRRRLFVVTQLGLLKMAHQHAAKNTIISLSVLITIHRLAQSVTISGQTREDREKKKKLHPPALKCTFDIGSFACKENCKQNHCA